MEKVIKFKYQGVEYSCDYNNLSNYMKVNNGVIGIYQKGVDNPYCEIDRANKTLYVNSEIEAGTFGQGGEATRIKLCAVLNAAISMFEAQGWNVEYKALGAIVCTQSSLDNRRKKTGVDIAELFANIG